MSLFLLLAMLLICGVRSDENLPFAEEKHPTSSKAGPKAAAPLKAPFEGSADKTEICGNPHFDSGLAVIKGSDETDITRYLFRGQYAMPYIRDDVRQHIVWKNITRITELFPGLDAKSGIKLAFCVADKKDPQIFLFAKGSDKIQVYKHNEKTKHFEHNRTIDWNLVPFQYIQWKVTTIVGQVDTGGEEMDIYFVDSTSKPVANSTQQTKSLPSGTSGKYNFEFKYSSTMDLDNQILLAKELFPNTIVMTNNANIKIRVPVYFDGYYQAKNVETVFFYGKSACVYMAQSQTYWKESDYCRKWVDTRGIIGCYSDDSVKGEPESDPNEPDDIDPGF